MLAINLDRHEPLWIGRDIKLKITGMKGRKFVVCIEAPPHIPIVRNTAIDKQPKLVKRP